MENQRVSERATKGIPPLRYGFDESETQITKVLEEEDIRRHDQEKKSIRSVSTVKSQKLIQLQIMALEQEAKLRDKEYQLEKEKICTERDLLKKKLELEVELEKSFYSLNDEGEARSVEYNHVQKWIDEISVSESVNVPIKDTAKVDDSHSSDMLTQVVNAFTAGIKDLANNRKSVVKKELPDYEGHYELNLFFKMIKQELHI